MTVFPCEARDCSSAGTIYLSRIENRVVVDAKWLCEEHRNDFLDDFLRRCSSSDYVASTTTDEITDFVPVDLHLILYDQRLFDQGTCCWVYLAEIGGLRRLAVSTGYFEASNLQWELEGQTFRRPPTHRVVAGLIGATGGQLECAVIDEYQESEQIYGAKLHLAYGQRSLALDVRPSDAFTVAVACGAPLLVSNDVLEKAGRTPPP